MPLLSCAPQNLCPAVVMRICIVTGAYYNPHETMVNYHIANLFGGNVVVLAPYQIQDDPFGLPHHFWAPGTESGSSAKAALADKIKGMALHRTARVPFGESRRGIQNFLRTQKVDAVLVEFGNVAVRVTPAISEMGIPLFSYFRGADASMHLRQPFRASAYRRMMPHLRGIFAVSQFLLDNLGARGVSHENSLVVPSGVNTSLFVPDRKTPESFLAVGRFVEKKRPDITVEAFCNAARTHSAARLELIGDGPMLEACKAIAARLGMADRVIFHGSKPHDFVRERMARTEVFLQHSVTGRDGNTEGLPIAIQEAMSCGSVVISTLHAGIPEAVTEGETGFLVAEGDAEGFSQRILRTLVAKDILPPMYDRAREIACQRFDNRKLIKVVEDRIRELSK